VRRTAATVAISIALLGARAQDGRAQEAPGRTVAPVVRLLTPPLFDAEGRPATDAHRAVRLLVQRIERLLSDRDIVVPYALTIPGVVCDELKLFDGEDARRAIAGIKRLASNHVLLASSYADAPFDISGSRKPGGEIDDQRRAMRACAGRDPRQPLVPPRLSLADAQTVRALRLAGVRSALSAYAVPPLAYRPRILPAVAVDARMGPDELLRSRREADAVAVMLDADRTDVTTVLRWLGTDRRFTTVDITALRNVDVVDGLIDTDQPSLPHVGTAARQLDRLDSIALPHNRLVDILRTELARARQPNLARSGRAQGLVRTIARQLSSIHVAGGGVTFTARQGSVPLTIANRTRYPFRLRVTVSSPKLFFPQGRSRVFTVSPPGNTITFTAIARSTGTFPVDVRVGSPDRKLVLDTAELTVRSTAVNFPALVLTAGGAAFFLFWFGRRVRRAHRDAGA
jgi:hypothetical protein